MEILSVLTAWPTICLGSLLTIVISHEFLYVACALGTNTVHPIQPFPTQKFVPFHIILRALFYPIHNIGFVPMQDFSYALSTDSRYILIANSLVSFAYSCRLGTSVYVPPHSLHLYFCVLDRLFPIFTCPSPSPHFGHFLSCFSVFIIFLFYTYTRYLITPQRVPCTHEFRIALPQPLHNTLYPARIRLVQKNQS